MSTREGTTTTAKGSSGSVKPIGYIVLVLGAIFVVAGIVTWIVVSNTLGDQKITTSKDACLSNQDVNGPFTAYCQATVIDKHVKNITGGKTYAELPQDDPNRATAQAGAFLQASLFTSVVAFGVAFMAFGLGVIFILIGIAMLSVAKSLAYRGGGGGAVAPPEAAA